MKIASPNYGSRWTLNNECKPEMTNHAWVKGKKDNRIVIEDPKNGLVSYHSFYRGSLLIHKDYLKDD